MYLTDYKSNLHALTLYKSIGKDSQGYTADSRTKGRRTDQDNGASHSQQRFGHQSRPKRDHLDDLRSGISTRRTRSSPPSSPPVNQPELRPEDAENLV